ncbi:MAG: PDZ domain-containing protein [Acidobacteria bacterium]|nr:PDZ domain-containing protein [Acidobacteriota bacterium]
MSPRVRLLVALASTGLIGYVAVGSLLARALGDSGYGQLAIFNEVVRLVLDAYVEPVNVERAMAGARLGMTDALDGDSAYLDAEQFLEYQRSAPEQDADIGLTLTRRFSFLMVVGARPGSPAEQAGLRAGDIIKSIDGRHSRPVPAVIGQRRLRGAPGSTVTLGILRAGADPFDVSVVRERILPAPPEGRMLDGATGYLRVSDFDSDTDEALRTQIEVLKRDGATRMVLDLRGAGWGDPAHGAPVASLFMEGGVVARLVGRRVDETTLEADPAGTAWRGPLVVLVDSGTAGPGEIVAAALSDSARATLVGEHTFGRAARMQPVPLPEGGLILTVAKYMSPSGISIHGDGLEPGVKVAATDPNGPELEGEETGPDRILERALEVLSESAEQKAAA